MSDERPTRIEVFADVGCPFTHVGLLKFVEARDHAGRDDVVMVVRSWPLEVVNGVPLDPAFIAEEVDDLKAQLVPDRFSHFDVDRFPPTTVPAMALSAAAYRVDLRLGERVALEVRDRLFERGQDVSEPELLAEVAAGAGLDVDLDDRSAVLADHAEGRQRGVIGSPHFFTPHGNVFCPSLDIHREGGHLHITADAEAFDAFVRACFA